MPRRYLEVVERAGLQQQVMTVADLGALGIGSSTRSEWCRAGLLSKLGPRTFLVGPGQPCWETKLYAAMADVGTNGVVAGRSAARLFGLDGFESDDVEVLVPRDRRHVRARAVVRASTAPLRRADWVNIGPFRTVSVERLILDAGLFEFTRRELENAVDSAVRRKMVNEARLRRRLTGWPTAGRRGAALLREVMGEIGVESALERMFLRLCRRFGLPDPAKQVVYRDGERTIARVDFEFAGGLVVEVIGLVAHSPFQARLRDIERQNELTLIGKRVLTFTFRQVRDRPEWVVAQLRAGLAGRLGEVG